MKKKVCVTDYEYISDKVPAAFDNYKIAVLSDLHCKRIGRDNKRLINKVNDIAPDLIICAGDMVTDNAKRMNVTYGLLQNLSERYNIIYAYGNHELKLRINPRAHDRFISYINDVKNLGINVLNNTSFELSKDNEHIHIFGLNINRRFYTKIWKKVYMGNDYLDKLVGKPDNDELNILIAHNPEYFNNYSDWGADIVFSGHIHGGMVVLPYIGGVIAPSYRLFPYYDFGKYENDDSTMFLSRGLGSHTIPLRIFNPPEIMNITLRRTEDGHSC